MKSKKPKKQRPFETVMKETSENPTPWDLDEHLNGCLAAYQIEQSFGAAVALAFEALRGIAREVDLRAQAGVFHRKSARRAMDSLPQGSFPSAVDLDSHPGHCLGKVQLRRGSAWSGIGLEGGQGKSPTLDKLQQMLDERAIAHWIWWRVNTLRDAGEDIRIEDVIQEGAEKFDKADITVRRAWEKFRKLQKAKNKK